MDPGAEPVYQRDVSRVKAALDEASFQSEWKAGQALTTEQAVEVALSGDETG